MPKPQAKSVLGRAPVSSHPIAPKSEPAPLPASPPVPPAVAAGSATPETEPTEMHSARIPKALKQRMKVHSAVNDVSMQDITILALTDWLDKSSD